MAEDNALHVLETEVSKEVWADACRAMWIAIFQDRETYVDYYLSHMWKRNTVLIRAEEEKLQSMLHLNPYLLQVGDRREIVHYVVGVSTKEELRGRGYMGELIRFMFRLLRLKGERWIYLMPAAEAIYRPYQFEAVYHAKTLQARFTRRDQERPDCEIRRFLELSGAEQQAVENFARQVLRERFAVFPVHSTAYLREVAEQMRTYDGDLLVFYHGEEIVGYTSYLYEEENIAEITEMVYRSGWEEKIREAMGGEWHEEPARCLIMARILDFPAMARQLTRPASWGSSIVLQIRDPLIPENQGNWRLSFGEETRVQAVAEKPDEIMEISEFTSLWFAQHPVFINDLV